MVCSNSKQMTTLSVHILNMLFINCNIREPNLIFFQYRKNCGTIKTGDDEMLVRDETRCW